MIVRLAVCLLLLVQLTGCALNRALVSPYAKLDLVGGCELNPDAQGRPSPLSLKVYELASRTAFDNLDFDAAYFNAEAVLGDDLLSASAHVILPDQQLYHRIGLARDARYVAVVAAYREIDRAHWKLVYPVNRNWYHRHEVQLTADRVALVD